MDGDESRMQSSKEAPPTAKIQRAFDVQTEALLDHLLARENLSMSTWKTLLWKLSGDVAHLINVDAQMRPKTISILDYVRAEFVRI